MSDEALAVRREPDSIQFRAASPGSWDAEKRTFTVIASTGARVRRFDWLEGEFEESLGMDQGHIRLGSLTGAPFLDSHDMRGTDSVVGTVERAWIEGGKLMADVRLAADDERADRMANKLGQGILGRVSVGYRVHKYEEIRRQKDQMRHLRAVDWEPMEVSMVAIPADKGARVRDDGDKAPCDFHLRAVPAPLETREMTTAVEAGAGTAQPPVNLDSVRAEAVAQERLRIAGIRETARKLRLSEEFAEQHLRDGTDLVKFREVAVDEHERRAAQPAPVSAPVAALPPVEPQVAQRDEPGLAAARIIRALAASRGDPERAASWSHRNYGENAPITHVFKRALAAGVATAGGFIVPDNYMAEIIELLRPASVVRRMGATNPPMPGGNIMWPKLTGGASAEYLGENQNLPKTEQTFGQLKLTARKLGALIPISNDLIRFSSPQADTVVRDDLVSALAQREDAAFIRDQGLGNAPKGLRYACAAANRLTVNATVNLANVTTDLGRLVLALKNANVRMIRPGWLMAPRTENYLMTIRDGNGNFAFRDEMLRGRLWGYPYATTTQIPINLAVTNTSETEIYFADFADVVIADVPGLIIDVSSEAAYHDGSNVVAAFSLDQTVIRAIAQHDMGLRHDASVAVLTDVDWGA